VLFVMVMVFEAVVKDVDRVVGLCTTTTTRRGTRRDGRMGSLT
jgi:hypothetical protein